MSMTAFRNDSTVKAIALAEVAGLTGTADAWGVEASDDQRLECSGRFGLAPCFLNLAANGLHVPYGADAITKLHGVLEAIQPGVNTLELVRSWVLMIWDEPTFGIKSHLEGSEILPAAEAVIRLVQEAASNEVPREAWRNARSALNAVKATSGGDLEPFADVVVNMCWDLEKSPRVTTDIWNSWEASSTAMGNRKAGWGAAEQEAVLNAVRDAHTVVYTKLGPPPADATEAAEFHVRAQQQVAEELKAQGMDTRFEELKVHIGTYIQPTTAAWKACAEQTLLKACRAAQVVATA